MAAKPFIAARIPEDLNLKLEEHSKSTGESKTQALVNALAAYLGFTLQDESKESANGRLSRLEKKVEELERILKEPRQISFLEDPEVKQAEITLKKLIKPDNKPDNNTFRPSVIGLDNNIDNNQQVELVQKLQPPEPIGKYLGRFKTQDVPNLDGLKKEDSKKIKIKLNNTKNTKVQSTQIGRYFVALVKTEESIKSKKQELLWDVYDRDSAEES